MTGVKKSFANFLRPVAPDYSSKAESAPVDSLPQPDRIKHITPTGRVRTYSANRALPGVTLRLSEARWERLKMLSIHERRPIQDILGEAMDAYMQKRGLPW